MGPPSIIKPTLAACTRIVFCSNSPLQEAAASGLEQMDERGYLPQTVKEYDERRVTLTEAFDKLGMKYSRPQGTYFVLLVRIVCKLKYSLGTHMRNRTSPVCIGPITTRSQRAYMGGDETSSTGFLRFCCIPHFSPIVRRACWFIAMEVGVSAIPVSEVRALPGPCLAPL